MIFSRRSKESKLVAIIACLVFYMFINSCINISSSDPYSDFVRKVEVNVQYPEGFSSCLREDVVITLGDISQGTTYEMKTNKEGRASLFVPAGIYRISVSDRVKNDIFNGVLDRILVSKENLSLNLELQHSKAGTLVIKEIYSGGCLKLPEKGKYQSDRYFIIHNNDNRPIYLDSLCFSTVYPFNSNANNPWLETNPSNGELACPNFAPVNQAIWQFGGTGKSFPLQPGEDAVVVINGAINHSAKYPLSVDLNKPDYFVCYNITYFPSALYHPAPGDKIKQERILEVACKIGRGNAYIMSLNSPVLVIFRPKGCTIKEYVNRPGSIVSAPGSSMQNVIIPLDWIIDGVEVFNGMATNNNKRLNKEVDAGFVYQTDVFKGYTLFRRTDEEKTQEAGYEVLQDTNNSTKDFYERKTQSLHE